jgi:RNA polymerase sigma-70 factor (ECF subfamily)
MAFRRRQAVGDKVVRRAAWTREVAARGADEPVIRFESVEAVRQAIAELPAEQQQIVRMRIYDEKTFAVISQELQIPLGTALGRMRTALQRLRKQLEELDS